MVQLTKRAINKFVGATALFLVITIIYLGQHIHSTERSDEVDGEELANAVDGSHQLFFEAKRRRQEMLTQIRYDHSNTHHHHRREVINGSRTESISDYPYMVSLLNKNSQNQIWHTCGGTLIAPNIGKG